MCWPALRCGQPVLSQFFLCFPSAAAGPQEALLGTHSKADKLRLSASSPWVDAQSGPPRFAAGSSGGMLGHAVALLD